jgi:xanthine/CO dehydrogenase XdhC/CoxF family maturation factor
MANKFGTDILIQALEPKSAARFYVDHLGFEITDEKPTMVSLCGEHINLFIERGPAKQAVLRENRKKKRTLHYAALRSHKPVQAR